MWWVEGSVLGASGVTVASAQGMCCAQSKTLWTRPPFLTICWVIGTWGPVLFRSLEPCGPTSVYIVIAKISLFSWLVRDVPVLVSLHWGGGVVFLKATSYVRPVLLLSLFCLLFCCSALPFSPTSPPWILESIFAIFVFTVGWALRFISCFICKSSIVVVFSFLSLRKLWLRFYLRF